LHFEEWDENKTLNIVAIGAGATGKTQTIERYAQGTYVDKYGKTYFVVSLIVFRSYY
jgi:GTPase SAR1 family protein